MRSRKRVPIGTRLFGCGVEGVRAIGPSALANNLNLCSLRAGIFSLNKEHRRWPLYLPSIVSNLYRSFAQRNLFHGVAESLIF